MKADVLPEDLSWWNQVGWDYFTSSQMLSSASRLAVDIEMTLKILDVRKARDENHGRWPDLLPGVEKSDNCPQDHWVYKARSDGSMRLELSRRLVWGTVVGTQLPTTYEVGDRAPRRKRGFGGR